MGIPVGGGGGGYGMPSPAMMMMNHDHPMAKVEGETSTGGRTRRRIYSVLGRLAISAVTTSIIGFPLGI